jgi:3,4-dihydroxy 2-butanone 4-phosphate synthase/GTP cyclohydrolase II
MICLEDHINREVHLALVRGEIDARSPTLVRVHRQDTLSDVVGIRDRRLGWPLRDAMRHVAKEGRGVIVILRHEEGAREFMGAVRALAESREVAAPRRERVMDLRTFGTGAQVLRALGVRKMRVMSAPKHIHALSGFGLEVVEYVAPQESAPGEDEGDAHG